MKKVVLIFAMLLTEFFYLYPFDVEMTNEYLRIIGDTESGRFIIKTTGGDPSLNTDQNALLLYRDYPPTSITTIRIDNINYKFGNAENGKFISRMKKYDDIMVTVWSVKNIEIKQTLKFVKGPTTGRLDTVEISYNIWNRDSQVHNIGIRIMLDTCLGDSDGAPFRIPGVGDVTAEKEFVGNKIPNYWYAYDDLGRPTVRAQGTVKIKGAPIPDKIIFASWERFNKYLWNFEVKQERSFRRSLLGPLDSAVAIYWNPHKYNPNDIYTVKTYYGLYGGTLYKGKVFNVSLGGPVTTAGDPFLATVDIQNVSPYKAKDVTALILLPKGLKLVGNEMDKKTVGALDSKEIKKTSFNIFPDGSKHGIITYKVKVSGIVNGKLESVIVERNINYTGMKYTLYDFTEINKLIYSINKILIENNSKLNELNKLIKTMGTYPKEQARNDRMKIKNRIKRTKNNENKIPEAVKSVEKVVKK